MFHFQILQVENNDGLPPSVCLQCFHNINTAFSFKTLCEQSDTNLRQYLGKPMNQKNINREDQQKNEFSTPLFLDGFGMYSSSGESDDDDFPLLESVPDNPNDEKFIAQKQLLKSAKMHKSKISKKISSKNGGTKGEGVFSNYPVYYHFLQTKEQFVVPLFCFQEKNDIMNRGFILIIFNYNSIIHFIDLLFILEYPHYFSKTNFGRSIFLMAICKVLKNNKKYIIKLRNYQ